MAEGFRGRSKGIVMMNLIYGLQLGREMTVPTGDHVSLTYVLYKMTLFVNLSN